MISYLEEKHCTANIVWVFFFWKTVNSVDANFDTSYLQCLFLSRGLLLPRVVVDDHGGKRSDPGMLGSGIYFASAAR